MLIRINPVGFRRHPHVFGTVILKRCSDRLAMAVVCTKPSNERTLGSAEGHLGERTLILAQSVRGLMRRVSRALTVLLLAIGNTKSLSLASLAKVLCQASSPIKGIDQLRRLGAALRLLTPGLSTGLDRDIAPTSYNCQTRLQMTATRLF